MINMSWRFPVKRYDIIKSRFLLSIFLLTCASNDITNEVSRRITIFRLNDAMLCLNFSKQSLYM